MPPLVTALCTYRSTSVSFRVCFLSLLESLSFPNRNCKYLVCTIIYESLQTLIRLVTNKKEAGCW